MPLGKFPQQSDKRTTLPSGGRKRTLLQAYRVLNGRGCASLYTVKWKFLQSVCECVCVIEKPTIITVNPERLLVRIKECTACRDQCTEGSIHLIPVGLRVSPTRVSLLTDLRGRCMLNMLPTNDIRHYLYITDVNSTSRSPLMSYTEGLLTLPLPMNKDLFSFKTK